jgi:hypothetical protein
MLQRNLLCTGIARQAAGGHRGAAECGVNPRAQHPQPPPLLKAEGMAGDAGIGGRDTKCERRVVRAYRSRLCGGQTPVRARSVSLRYRRHQSRWVGSGSSGCDLRAAGAEGIAMPNLPKLFRVSQCETYLVRCKLAHVTKADANPS